MSLVSSVFPTIDNALLLEPEELAVPLIECLCGLEDDSSVANPNRNGFTQYSNLQDYCERRQYDAIAKAILEAWGWLEHEGLILPDLSGNEWYFVTRRGRKFKEIADTAKFKATNLLPYETLDPLLAGKIRPPFIRGDYDSAVFEAFKQVEIRVRQLASLSKEDIGVNLMRKAFKPGNGPLIDHKQTNGEQQGIMDLFAGAIGSFKNPSSHRDVDFSDPVEAVELIMFADSLIRITERRKPKKRKKRR
ncbi:TIGR02391 family protein [Thermodesulfobacteriota bacterium]